MLSRGTEVRSLELLEIVSHPIRWEILNVIDRRGELDLLSVHEFFPDKDYRVIRSHLHILEMFEILYSELEDREGLITRVFYLTEKGKRIHGLLSSVLHEMEGY